MADRTQVAGVDVELLPAESARGELAVVIDVLRATSTIVQALDAGYESVLCCDSLDGARRMRGPGRVLAGERDCVPATGFDIGNSPAAIGTGEPLGDELVLATTNGTPAVVAAARRFDRVLIGSLLNLEATVAAIPQGARLAIVCSGTDGRAALEDAYVAGRIVERLAGPVADGARIALGVAEGHGSARAALAASADGAVLRSTGQERDIDWCAADSVIDLVPEVSAATGTVAAVGVPREAMREDDPQASKYIEVTL